MMIDPENHDPEDWKPPELEGVAQLLKERQMGYIPSAKPVWPAIASTYRVKKPKQLGVCSIFGKVADYAGWAGLSASAAFAAVAYMGQDSWLATKAGVCIGAPMLASIYMGRLSHELHLDHFYKEAMFAYEGAKRRPYQTAAFQNFGESAKNFSMQAALYAAAVAVPTYYMTDYAREHWNDNVEVQSIDGDETKPPAATAPAIDQDRPEPGVI